MLFTHATLRADSLLRTSEGNSKAAKTAIMAATTRSSINVKARTVLHHTADMNGILCIVALTRAPFATAPA
jgi:hypothetical protein